MMARFWQSNDIEDEAVIAKFAEKIGDAERLKYLYVLTFCDSMGTSSTLWNSYKQSLHTLLYRNTVRRLEKDEEQMEAFYEERRQSIIDRVLNSPEIETSKEEVLAHFENLPRKYFVFHGIDDILLHLNLAHIFAEALKQSPENTMPVFEWRNDPNMSMSTITIVSEDRGGLFYKLASALTYTGLNILGSKALYDYIDYNKDVELYDVAWTNDPQIIRQNPCCMAINSAVEVDLTGQICADSIGDTIISGVGGQHDFMYGSALSEGGKCFIALPSMTSKGQSKIVAHLAPGAGVVTTRFQAQYIVTEHGIVYLRNKPIMERAKLLISIADPSVREELERAAVERFGIGFLRYK